MSHPFLDRIQDVYGDEIAAEVRGELDHSQGQSGVAALAKVLARHQEAPHHLSDPFTSVPLPMEFNPATREDP